ncbi:MAG: c-type cytochrome, partial [Roseimicrobium sp.]
SPRLSVGNVKMPAWKHRAPTGNAAILIGQAPQSLNRPVALAARADAGQSRESRDMDLSKLATPELVKLLEHPNNWMRRMARRMLAESWQGEWSLTTKPPPNTWLRPLILEPRPVQVSLEAAWAMLTCDDLPQDVLAAMAAAENPALRAWAARLSGERFRLADQHIASIADGDNMTNSDKENEALGLLWQFTERLDKLSSDPDITVRLACAIGQQMTASSRLTVTKPLNLEAKIFRAKVRTHIQLNDLIQSSAKDADALLSYMIWRAMEPGISDFACAPEALEALSTVAATSQPLSRILTYKSMRRLCDTRKSENLDLAIGYCEKMQAHDILLAHALDGLVKGQEGGVLKPTVDVSKQLAAWRASANAEVRKHAQNLAVLWGDEAAITELLAVASSATAAQDARLQALQTLRKVKSDTVRDGLAQLLSSASPQAPALIIEAIRAAADMGGDAMPPALLKLAASKDFGIQQAALSALAGRAEWAHAMLDAISAGKVSAVGFPVSVRRSLATSQDKAIRDHAFNVLGAWKEASDDTKALIAAKRKACLEGEPDLAMGKMLFTTTCATCHTFHGGGQKVGPELIGSGRSNLDALLANVIDPNQIIGNGYEAINVLTKDNRTVSGRMVEDTPGHVKLLAIGGAEQIVPRDQIAKLENTHQSLMPMGFGALPDDAFRSLVWYILAPPEEGPLTKEKKAALSASIDTAHVKKPGGTNWRAIDWESVSLWNPEWKVSAPDFERTPVKLADYHGRKNVLLMHPFAKDKPCSLERTVMLAADKPHTLSVTVAAHDQGDWELRVLVNGKLEKSAPIDHDGQRWKTVTVDLSEFAGKEVALRLEGAATGWAWEFGYWGEVKVE